MCAYKFSDIIAERFVSTVWVLAINNFENMCVVYLALNVRQYFYEWLMAKNRVKI